MSGYALLVGFLALGVTAAWALMPRKSRAVRVYFGLSLGLVMMMWLPSIVAFSTRFTALAQYIALGVMAVGTLIAAAVARFVYRGREIAALSPLDHPPLRLTLWLVVPLVLLSAYLLHTHIIRPGEFGELYVGQSTYGDLSLHLGIATGLRDAAYPPEYTLLPGTLLGYPFLSDAMVASMLVLGADLRLSFILTGLLMMGLVYWGFVILSWRLTKSVRATALAYVLFFLNGGLGFLYMLDGWPSDWSRLVNVFTGYYQTPTNLPDLNLRWVNVICDLMVPQRTLLAGWMMVIPALIMLHEAIRSRQRYLFVALGLWAGLMPMVHTHSFLALGLISLGALVYAVRRDKGEQWTAALNRFGLYGLIAVALALPQMAVWTFPQTLRGGSLRPWFNWVNWDEHRGLIDGYFWFWIKNMGPVYLVMLPAALHQKRTGRALALGALAVYVAAELFVFQPNIYDNNKLFIVAFMLMVPLCARYLVDVYDRLRGIPGRKLLAGAFIAVSMLSALMTIGREVIFEAELFSANEARAAYYVDANAEKDAVFATSSQHNNPISSLAGRKLVCGTPTFLYYHGVDYSRQLGDVRMMFEAPEQSRALFEEHGVGYIYISSWERGGFAVDEAEIARLFPLWHEAGDVSIYKVEWPEEA